MTSLSTLLNYLIEHTFIPVATLAESSGNAYRQPIFLVLSEKRLARWEPNRFSEKVFRSNFDHTFIYEKKKSVFLKMP